jgi:transposase
MIKLSNVPRCRIRESPHPRPAANMLQPLRHGDVTMDRAAGLAANLYRRTATARDARRIARRFLAFEDLILRFATRAGLDILTSNAEELTIRPVKVQQRSSGGCRRTLQGLADFAVVQSCLSTVAK